MTSERPNPDKLLARVHAEESASRRGKLKIFFGYAAGVGKTYAMLKAAQRERADGVDVVAGYVEPHGRPETEALLEGLESLPPRLIPYRGISLREFDIDVALARRPRLILVDELAHTNAEGMRHAKRWQDVDELLQDGMDVFTTLNVQHVESLNDVIAQITGVVVHETLPDTILERADDIELVDLTPEELAERLRDGKIYIPQQAERALQHFFQKANLVALRELSLRQVAQRLSRDVAAARQEKASQAPWATSERLLVCVGPSPTGAKLIRATKRMASAFGADWLVVAVEPQGTQNVFSAARQRISEHLRLAEQLGAETHTLVGDDVAQTLIDFARLRNVTKIVVGKTAQPRWKRFLFGTVVDTLLDRSGDIEVYVIRGEPDKSTPTRPPNRRAPTEWSKYVWTGLVVSVCGLVGWLSHTLQLTEANICMVFILGIVFVAVHFGRGAAIAASVASVLAFDFFFVRPYLTFTVLDAQYLLTFAVMLVVGIVISTLTARIQDQLRDAQQVEHRTAALFRLAKQLSQVAGPEFLIRMAGEQLREIFDGEIVVFVREGSNDLELRYGKETSIARHDVNSIVAHWVAEHEQLAGAGTDTLPNATAIFVPLIGSQRTIGAMGIKPSDSERFLDPEQRRLLETCASLIALSLERDQSVLEASEAELQVHSEQLRNSLLSSVSHDLRTPLAAITGASSTLVDNGPSLSDDAREELAVSIRDEAERLNRLVANLLDMTQLASGSLQLHGEWHSLSDLIGDVVNRHARLLRGREIVTHVPPDMTLVFLDELLMHQVLANLLENAHRYAPPDTPIEVSASMMDGKLMLEVSDHGPGFAPGEERMVFEKFYHSTRAGLPSGAGLGLAICRGITELHGGTILAENRLDGGAVFRILLPQPAEQPSVPQES